MPPTRTPAPRPPRSDAAVNRERLLAAAVEEIAARGDKVPMADIAARAGVGVGTLYRHFADREALLRALTERAFALVLEHARAARDSAGTAREAIGRYFAWVIADRRQLILPLHGGPPDLDPEARRLQTEIRVTLEALLARGVQDGSVRADISARDIIITGAQLAQPLAQVDDWDAIARRQAELFLGALRPTPPAGAGG